MTSKMFGDFFFHFNNENKHIGKIFLFYYIFYYILFVTFFNYHFPF